MMVNLSTISILQNRVADIFNQSKNVTSTFRNTSVSIEFTKKVCCDTKIFNNVFTLINAPSAYLILKL